MSQGRIAGCLVALLLVALGCASPPPPPDTTPLTPPSPGSAPGAATIADNEIRLLVQPLLLSRATGGVVVGVLDASGPRAFGYGRGPFGGPLSGDTLFELGSLSKLFTSLILAQLHQEGALSVEDSLGPHLGAPQLNPELKLWHLAAHSSGLPTTPPNGSLSNYQGHHLEALVSNVQLTTQPGKAFLYNNFGFGVLGYALSRHTRTPFEVLIHQRICDPLKLHRTGVRPRLDPTAPLDRSDTESDLSHERIGLGASGLRSTANDMLTFLAAHLDRPAGSRTEAMTLAQTPRGPSWPGNQVGLGWHIGEEDGTIWHQGAIGDYRSYVGINPDNETAVVVWSNPRTDYVDHVGLAILHRLAGSPLYIPTVAPEEWDGGRDDEP